MVGLLHKLLFQLVRELAGEEAVLTIKQKAGIALDQEYKINHVYSDEEWRRLYDTALEVLHLTAEQADALYGDYFIKDTIKRFPTWFEMSKNSYELLSMQPTIHSCFSTSIVDKASSQSINKKFKIEQHPNHLITHYCSPNHHCSLYIFIAKRAIEYYQDEAVIEEKKCSKRGAPECEIHIRWSRLGN